MSAPANTSLALDGELTIYRAAELKPVLLATLEGAGPVVLDLSGVTEVDTAGLQLLMLTRHAALARGLALQLHAPSPAVVSAIELLDLAAFFGLPEAVADAA